MRVRYDVGYIISTFDEYTMSLILKGKGFSASTAHFLNVLSVFAVFTLLHFKSELPGGRYLHEPVLQPNKVFPEAPV